MWEFKGSYTVEAALIVPILIFTMAIALKMGIMLYQEICEDEQGIYVMDEVNAVDNFYKYQKVKGVLEHD